MRLRVAPLALSLLFACGGSEVHPEPAAKVSPASAPVLPRVHEAVGPVDELSPELRAAFEDSPGFAEFDPGGPHDWVASFGDQSRTAPMFRISSRNVPDERRDTIYLLPIGEFDAATSPPLPVLEQYLEAYFGLATEVLEPIPLESLDVTQRQRETGVQLKTGDVLDELRTRLPANAYCLLGLTMKDLYPGESWNYVFGEATFEQRVGIYSFVRYTPAFWGQPADEGTAQRLLVRGLKTMTHEAGHMFGMHHCTHYACNMNGSNNLDEADRQPLSLCPVCLRKLHIATELDPTQRYERLLEFYREQGLAGDAAWTERRLDYLRGATER